MSFIKWRSLLNLTQNARGTIYHDNDDLKMYDKCDLCLHKRPITDFLKPLLLVQMPTKTWVGFYYLNHAQILFF